MAETGRCSHSSETYACGVWERIHGSLNTLAKTIYPRRLDRREHENKRTNTAIPAGYDVAREERVSEVSFAFSGT